MNKIKTWLKRSRNKVIAGVCAALLVVTGVCTGVVISDLITPKPIVEFKKDVIFEYGQATYVPKYLKYALEVIKLSDYVDEANSKYDSISYYHPDIVFDMADDITFNIPTDKVGNNFTVTIYATLGEVIETFELTYSVVDSNRPVFNSVLNIDTPHNEIPNFNEIITATDVVDGKLKVVIDGDIDYQVAGVYDMEASATDKNGNISKHSFTVTVNAE